MASILSKSSTSSRSARIPGSSPRRSRSPWRRTNAPRLEPAARPGCPGSGELDSSTGWPRRPPQAGTTMSPAAPAASDRPRPGPGACRREGGRSAGRARGRTPACTEESIPAAKFSLTHQLDPGTAGAAGRRIFSAREAGHDDHPPQTAAMASRLQASRGLPARLRLHLEGAGPAGAGRRPAARRQRSGSIASPQVPRPGTSPGPGSASTRPSSNTASPRRKTRRGAPCSSQPLVNRMVAALPLPRRRDRALRSPGPRRPGRRRCRRGSSPCAGTSRRSSPAGWRPGRRTGPGEIFRRLHPERVKQGQAVFDAAAAVGDAGEIAGGEPVFLVHG